MHKHNESASDYGIIDESVISELTAEIRQDKAHDFPGKLQVKYSESKRCCKELVCLCTQCNRIG